MTSRSAFGTKELPAQAYRDMSAQMLGRLDQAVAAVPGLARHDRAVRTAFEEVATLTDPLEVQRIHGDYHLGQVMRTHAGWVLLDFEGEPAVPLEQPPGLLPCAARRGGHAALPRLRRALPARRAR